MPFLHGPKWMQMVNSGGVGLATKRGGLAAPDTPTNLTATAVSASQIDLAWDAVSGATGYKIERGTDGVSFALVDTVGAVVAYEDTGLAAGTYYYRIAATNAGGDSGYSDTASAILYLLRDEFTTDEAAPLASPRAAEPGPGTLTIVDTGNKMSISGALILSTAVAAYNPRIESALLSRIAGRALIGKWNATAGRTRIGWRQSVGAVEELHGIEYDPISNRIAVFGPSSASGAWQSAFGTDYLAALPLRASAGCFCLVKGGDYISWTLVWIDNGGVSVNVVALYTAILTTDEGALDSMRVADLPAPFDTDYGLATNRTESPGDGATITSEANAIIEVTITAATGVTQELDVRRTDDDNRWIVRMNQAGNAIQIVERNAGVETVRASAAQTWTNGTLYRVVAILEGNTIKPYVDNVIKNTYASATFNNTATGVKISHAASNLIAWPRTLSGAALTALEAVDPT